MAGSAGWAVITYRELVLLLEKRNSFILETCSCGQAFVEGVRISKVTGTREPEPQRGCFLVIFGETRLEDGLLGSVIKMLTSILNFLQRCQLLWKKMLVFPPISDQKLYMGTELLLRLIFFYFWKKGEVVFSERQRSPLCFLFPRPLKDSKNQKAFNNLQLNTHGCFFFYDTFYYIMCSMIYCLLKFLKEHLREQPSWKGRGQSAPVKTGRVMSPCSMKTA